MKKLLSVLLLIILLTGCGDSRNISYFTNKLSEKYTITESDKTWFFMIGAIDGRYYKINDSVIQIYRFKDKQQIVKARQEFEDVAQMTQNNLFLAKSNSQELLDFFKKC